MSKPRKKFPLRYRIFLVALIVLPQAAALYDLALGTVGPWASLALFAVLQVPLILEMRRVAAHREASRLELVGWQAYYALWVGAIFYALAAGWFRVAAAALGWSEGAMASPPVWLGALPFAISFWGVFVGQHLYRRPAVHLEVADLGSAWNGTRIVHLSDIHVGRFIGARRLRRLASSATDLRPDLVVVTGDIVDSSADFAPLAAKALASIQAPLGVWAVLGNHDHYAGAAAVQRALEEAGIHVLVNRGTLLDRDGQGLWMAGVDDLWHGADLAAALDGRPEGVPTLLLSHQPNLFPDAAGRGVAVTLCGHTHGGQLAVPFVRSLSMARFISPFVAGVYRAGRSLLYVNRGAGAIRPLLRFGAPPEVAQLVLTRAGG